MASLTLARHTVVAVLALCVAFGGSALALTIDEPIQSEFVSDAEVLLAGRIATTFVRGEEAYRRHADGSETFGPPGLGRRVRRETQVAT